TRHPCARIDPPRDSQRLTEMLVGPIGLAARSSEQRQWPRDRTRPAQAKQSPVAATLAMRQQTLVEVFGEARIAGDREHFAETACRARIPELHDAPNVILIHGGRQLGFAPAERSPYRKNAWFEIQL